MVSAAVDEVTGRTICPSRPMRNNGRMTGGVGHVRQRCGLTGWPPQGGLPKHDPAVMLSMLVLLWTPVAMFRLSGGPMIRDDLHLVTRAQPAGPSAAF